MSTPSIVPVILSGGSGTRLWPASRTFQPKQLLPLVGRHSLIGDTIARVIDLGSSSAPIIVTNSAHAVGIERAMATQGLEDVTLVIEPVGRNTAPAVASAAHLAIEKDPDSLLLVLPSDHAIRDPDDFRDAVRRGASLAAQGHLVTFGIAPTSPETGYGYIRSGTELEEGAFLVEEFVEKPDVAAARRYVESGRYSWNSGMFLFAANVYLDELAEHRPDIGDAVNRAVRTGKRVGSRILLDSDDFTACPAESIDYAVMEHTDHAVVLPIDPGWSDVGSWTALWEISSRDTDGNTIEGDAVVIDTRDSLIHGHDRLVAVVGVEDVVVVDTADAVLVTSMQASQRVKDLVDTLNRMGRIETQRSDWEPTPWGTVTATSHVPGLHGWIITVDPASATDMRTDDGMVFVRLVDGTGTVVIEDVEHRLDPTHAISIEPGAPWRVTNSGAEDLNVAVVRVDTVVVETTDMSKGETV